VNNAGNVSVSSAGSGGNAAVPAVASNNVIIINNNNNNNSNNNSLNNLASLPTFAKGNSQSNLIVIIVWANVKCLTLR